MKDSASPDARDIVDELTARDAKLSLGGSVHDPTDPVGRLLFNVLGMVAVFSVISTRRRRRRSEGGGSDLIRLRTMEGMKVAKGRLRGKKPKLNPKQEAHLVKLHEAGEHTTDVARSM